jgi:hypothetical protein
MIYSMKYIVALIILLGLLTKGLAQNSPGAAIAGCGGAGVVNTTVWSAFHNQAGLSQINGPSAGIYYENRFNIKELGDKGLVFAMPFGKHTFALSYRSLGYSAFSNSNAALAYAMRLTDKFGIGLQFNYQTIRIGENYGNRRATSFDAGFLYKLNDKFRLAGHIQNPTRAKIADYNDERLPSVVRFGIGYHFSNKVNAIIEVKKPSDNKPSLKGGIEYWPIDKLALRAGFGSVPSQITFGFGWKTKLIAFDVFAGFHQTLGITPQVSLTYSGKSE